MCGLSVSLTTPGFVCAPVRDVGRRPQDEPWRLLFPARYVEETQ